MKAQTIQQRGNHPRSHEALRAEYPVVLQALGERRFERFATAVRGRARARVDRRDAGGEGWWREPADFISDLARLEHSYNEVFFGLADETRVEAAAVRALSTEELGWVRLKTVAASRLLALRYPVVDFFRDVRAGHEPAAPGPAETFSLLTRGRDTVHIQEISRPEFVVLALLKRGDTVGDALSVLDAGTGVAGPLGTDARSWVEHWAARGLFSSISV